MNPDFLDFETVSEIEDRHDEPMSLLEKLNAGHFFPLMEQPVHPVPNALLMTPLVQLSEEDLEIARDVLLQYRAEKSNFEAGKKAIQDRYDFDWATIRELLRKENATDQMDADKEESIFDTACRISHKLVPQNDLRASVRSIQVVYKEITALVK